MFSSVAQEHGSSTLLLFRGTLEGSRQPLRSFAAQHPDVFGSCMRTSVSTTAVTFAWRATDDSTTRAIAEFCNPQSLACEGGQLPRLCADAATWREVRRLQDARSYPPCPRRQQLARQLRPRFGRGPLFKCVALKQRFRFH